MHFVEKKKYFKKNWSKAEGVCPSANLPKWRFSLFYVHFFKSNIKFSSANLLLTKKKREKNRIDNLSGEPDLGLICLQKNNFMEQILSRKQVSPLQPVWIPVNFPYALFCVAK